jgi:hypothetical protein
MLSNSIFARTVVGLGPTWLMARFANSSSFNGSRRHANNLRHSARATICRQEAHDVLYWGELVDDWLTKC